MYLDSAFPKSRRTIVFFASPANAERNVAGLPAVARALREVARTGVDTCVVSTGSDWTPSSRVTSEIERLAGDMTIIFAGPEAGAIGRANAISGELLCARRSFKDQQLDASAADDRSVGYSAETMLRLAERRVMSGTQKAADGIVSKAINRRISRPISGFLLRFDWIRPIHATVLTALIAIAMTAALLLGGPAGLVIGALLFQAASIVDGVDGEMARATFRCSDFGAAADSMVDAFTNIAFVGGVVANLWMAGLSDEAAIGAVGLAAMAVGLALLGMKAHASQGKFTFDFVKNEFGQRPSRLKTWLTWLTMRDFYALVGCILVATGHAAFGLAIFAVVAVGWLVVVCTVLALHSAPNSASSPSPTADRSFVR